MRKRKTVQTMIFATCCALLALALPACEDPGSKSGGHPTSSPPLATNVVIISIDGCRPDIMLRARTPNIRALMDRGSYSMWARTTEMSITLPSHTSMATGVRPEKHGVTWNKDLKAEEQVYPAVKTIFELAKENGMTTSLCAGKSKFTTLARPGSIDYFGVVPLGGVQEDAGTALIAADILKRYRPNVMFVHFAAVDSTGHAVGWGTPTQVAAIERADDAVGVVVKGIMDAGISERTLIILSADHGGAGISHGPNDPRSRHIPWIAVGPHVREDYDLTRFQKLTINTEDTYATSCYFLGLPLAGYLDGKPVLEILDQEMLAPVAK